jgi:hypothetical protein
LKGWPFGIPSIQGVTFQLLRATGKQTLSNVINDTGWAFGQYDQPNGFGMFWDPDQYEVITSTMSLSRDPVFQGTDQFLDFTDDPLKISYEILKIGDIFTYTWEQQNIRNDLFLVIRNTRKTNLTTNDDVKDWLVSCRIWFST